MQHLNMHHHYVGESLQQILGDAKKCEKEMEAFNAETTF